LISYIFVKVKLHKVPVLNQAKKYIYNDVYIGIHVKAVRGPKLMNMSHSERRRKFISEQSAIMNNFFFGGRGVEARPQTVFKEKLGEWNLVCHS
jgi:hypothetical protein